MRRRKPAPSHELLPMGASSSNIITFTIVDLDVVEAICVDDYEALRGGVRKGARKSRGMPKLYSEAELS